MTAPITIRFKDYNEVECTGFSQIKQNNFDNPISLIFSNNRDSKRYCTLTSTQDIKHDFVTLMSKNKDKILIPKTFEVNGIFQKIYAFTIKPNSEKTLTISSSWVMKQVLTENMTNTDFKISLAIEHDLSLIKTHYDLSCFQILETNHNPYAPIVETETYLQTRGLSAFKVVKRPALNNATTFTPKIIPHNQNQEQVNPQTQEINSPKTPKKKGKFKKHRPGHNGFVRTTPSPPDVPPGAKKDWFITFSATNKDPVPKPKPKPPTAPTIKELNRLIGHKDSLSDNIYSGYEPELKKRKFAEIEEPVPSEAERMKSSIKDVYLRNILH